MFRTKNHFTSLVVDAENFEPPFNTDSCASSPEKKLSDVKATCQRHDEFMALCLEYDRYLCLFK